MTDTKKSTKSDQAHRKINWSTVKYAAFLLIWVAVAMTLSQYIIGLPLMWILGDKFSQPFYTCMYMA